MQISFDSEEVKLWPKEHRNFFLRQVVKNSSPTTQENINWHLPGEGGLGSSIDNSSLIYAGVAARDGEFCAQCGHTEDLQISHKVPVSLGGHATVDNSQLLCTKHHLIKAHRTSDITLITGISVEAAIALIGGLGDGSKNVLKAIVSLGSSSGVKRATLMNAPDFNLSFKNGRSLNGVITAIRKRFRSLIQEGERNNFDILEYDDLTDTYFLGEGTYSAIKECFDILDRTGNYLEDDQWVWVNEKINKQAVTCYQQGLGQVLEEFKLVESSFTTILALPNIKAKSSLKKPIKFHEHFYMNACWINYGGDSDELRPDE